MGFVEFLFETKKGKTIMGLIYGMGGAIVIIGALFKIMHWPGASAFLIIGLGTEAIIFAISAFEPPHFDVDWTLVYPELGGLNDELDSSKNVSSASNELDGLLQEGGVDSELITRLGEGMNKLASYTSNLSDITSLSTVSNDYADSLKNASDTVNTLSEKYESVAETLTGLSENANVGGETGQSLQKITSTLMELGETYQSQLDSAKDHTDKMNAIFGGINEMVENLSESATHSQNYKENIAQLSENLATLNRVYGNMVSAMNVSN